MALRLSTGLRNALMDRKASATVIKVAATTVSFAIGGGPLGGDMILDSANGFGNANPGEKITIFGSASNNGSFEILSVPLTGAYVEVASGSLTTEIAGATVTAVTSVGGSFSDLFRNGVMRIFAGTQPATGNSPEGSSHIVEISKASQTYSVGGENGINFGVAASGTLGKAALETWSGVAVATNTAGWFRFYDSTLTTGDSMSAIRFDGSIAQAGAQLNMSNTSIVNGGTTTIDSVAITLPTA